MRAISKIILTDFDDSSDSTERHPVDLDLGALGARPPKTFHLESTKSACKPLVLPDNLSVADALERVLRLPSVASKRYLTNKVDRSVTGLIAQQQCVGPLHTPVADVAVVALSYFDTVIFCPLPIVRERLII
uniref:FGAR-AT PurM N-terminal-like domain-containing protein n=1 Tax=Plectus sambesii TaxID=2011161 RepID=A0A914X779_9BILA